jgi:hypothetical protein
MMRAPLRGSPWFLKLQYEFIHRRGIPEDDVGFGVLRMPEKVGVGDELEARGLDLRPQCLLSDAVKLLADRGAVFRTSRVIRDY